MLGYFPDFIVLWAALLGLIAAVVFRARQWALYLISPAFFRWIVWPTIAPLLWAAIAQMPTWELVLMTPVAALAAVFACIKVLQGAVAGIYGSHVSIRVTSYALMATFRTIGRAIAFVFVWPVRAFKSLQTMDEMLRQWWRH